MTTHSRSLNAFALAARQGCTREPLVGKKARTMNTEITHLHIGFLIFPGRFWDLGDGYYF